MSLTDPDRRSAMGPWLPGAMLVALGLLLAALATLCIGVLSSARAYVGGESQWSKAQKTAMLNLWLYAEGQEPAAWAAYEQALAVPLGDRRAREAMAAPVLDRAAAREGLLAGGNHADDIDGMIRLFRWFGGVPFMARAIHIWAEADAEIDRMRALAQRVRAAVQSGADAATLRALRGELQVADQRLTVLEQRFSDTLGEASRMTQALAVGVMGGGAIALCALSLAVMRLSAARTQRQAAALRESEARRQRQLTGSSDGFWEWDLGRRQAFYSPRFEAILGHAPGSMPTSVETVQALLHPDDRARVRQVLSDHLRRGTPYDVELRMRHARGHWVWLRSRAQVDRGERGGQLRLAGSISDIGARLEAQRALQEAHQRLEQRVEERTRELRAANARLLEVDRLKSEFLATMSHELRTPLNAVLGFTELLLRDPSEPLSERQRTALGHVQASGRHLLALINDVLDLSGIESGHVRLAHEPLDAAAVLHEVGALLQPAAAAKGLALHLSAPEALPMHGDRRRLLQVMLNLINNAIKFTPAGMVEATLAVDGGRLCLTVRDTGIGIAPEHLPSLFQPFRQLDGSLGRSHEGTGLGLYLCRRIVDLMGGSIGARSVPGEGSTFSVALPWTAEVHQGIGEPA